MNTDVSRPTDGKPVTTHKFQYTPRSPYRLFLSLLKPEVVFSTLTRSLAPIGQAIQQSAEVIDAAQNSGNADYLEIVTNEEVDVIESLLGTAFVICQTNITCVVSRIMELHSFFTSREGRPLGSPDYSKAAILRHGSDVLHGSGYSSVEVIDAFANYFKHCDEWPPDWTQLSPRQAPTRDIISVCGAVAGSTGNLRAGAKALGNHEYHVLSIFAQKLEVWRARLSIAYEEELKREGVF